MAFGAARGAVLHGVMGWNQVDMAATALIRVRFDLSIVGRRGSGVTLDTTEVIRDLDVVAVLLFVARRTSVGERSGIGPEALAGVVDVTLGADRRVLGDSLVEGVFGLRVAIGADLGIGDGRSNTVVRLLARTTMARERSATAARWAPGTA